MRSLTTIADRILRALVPESKGAAFCASVQSCSQCSGPGRGEMLCCSYSGQCHEVCTWVPC